MKENNPQTQVIRELHTRALGRLQNARVSSELNEQDLVLIEGVCNTYNGSRLASGEMIDTTRVYLAAALDSQGVTFNTLVHIAALQKAVQRDLMQGGEVTFEQAIQKPVYLAICKLQEHAANRLLNGGVYIEGFGSTESVMHEYDYFGGKAGSRHETRLLLADTRLQEVSLLEALRSFDGQSGCIEKHICAHILHLAASETEVRAISGIAVPKKASWDSFYVSGHVQYPDDESIEPMTVMVSVDMQEDDKCSLQFQSYPDSQLYSVVRPGSVQPITLQEYLSRQKQDIQQVLNIFVVGTMLQSHPELGRYPPGESYDNHRMFFMRAPYGQGIVVYQLERQTFDEYGIPGVVTLQAVSTVNVLGSIETEYFTGIIPQGY